MRRIAVTGGRYFGEVDPDGVAVDVAEDLRKVLAQGPFVLISGGCPTGADSIAKMAAHLVGVEVELHPAAWTVHGRAAGPIRNAEMVASGLDGLILYPGGAGTEDMRTRCIAAGVPIWEPMKTRG